MERIEAALPLPGLPILGRSGKRLYGGHAFRVAGARFLSRMGIEVRVIALLGRWGSDVVLAYIKDAPLENLARAFLDHATAASSTTPSSSFLPVCGRIRWQQEDYAAGRAPPEDPGVGEFSSGL